MTIEQLRAESLAICPEPIATGPLAVDIIRRERDAKMSQVVVAYPRATYRILPTLLEELGLGQS